MKAETKAAAKARIIAARKAEKEAADMADRLLTTSNPIYTAIQPLLIAAKADAKVKAEARVKAAQAELEANGMDAEICAPYPKHSGMSVFEYKAKVAKFNFFRAITKHAGDGYARRMGSPDVRVMCPAGIARHIEMAQEAAAAQFEAYAWKLTRKIGKTEEATLAQSLLAKSTSPWEYSVLTVKLPGGTTQNWETKTIINHSVYGLAFYQWPTRLMKGGV